MFVYMLVFVYHSMFVYRLRMDTMVQTNCWQLWLKWPKNFSRQGSRFHVKGEIYPLEETCLLALSRVILCFGWRGSFLVRHVTSRLKKKKRTTQFVEAQWQIGYGVGLRIKRSSVRIRPWPLRWVLGQGSLLPLSQGEALHISFY